ncbi:glutaminyl-peptide cyclotransferase [Sphingomonas sp. LB-2]|uniref:glutaminyl-peptide cyclotransferase n=1 Tax=Sphingomonas caeni TaxID=2984949 RepID=UPI0022302DDB|nr:glutaminyl-peptide cyclotransferase [Sphingomonas caeni]MCW3848527.1 glutaminyl-peptide cyclotransferase [Sphingomonas caeni]
MKNKRILIIVLALAVIAVAVWFVVFSGGAKGVRIQAVKVVKAMPHDDQAFTEGLYFQGGYFFESTGEEGSSGFRKVTPETGAVVQSQEMPPPYFGEGIVGWKDRIYQLTWKDEKGFIYGANDFAQRGEFSYKGEGWGMTQDGTRIIMSDGSSTLRFLDPETMKPTGTLEVTAEGCPVKNLNELEWVDGEIYANIWQTDLIARIDPKTGHVLGFLDVTTLGPANPGRDDVANGIAYDAAGKRLFVTGKNWSQLYEVTAGEDVESAEAQTIMACAKQ